MHTATAPARPYSELVRHAFDLRKRLAWDELVALAGELPFPLVADALALADVVAFAMGRVRLYARALALTEVAYALEPTLRRASAAAWIAYASLLDQRAARDQVAPGGIERQAARTAFRRWMEETLRRDPRSIKDLYRLGVFEAQIESQHDKVALRAFVAAANAWEALTPEERARRGDLRKAYHRALYAGARSALRLKQRAVARRLAFTCVRSDRATDDVDPVFKLALAGKVCIETEEWEHAERALRLALDAKGPPRRDWLFGLLARVCLLRNDVEAGCRWIEVHIRPERRSAATWRLLGDLRTASMALGEAAHAYEHALRRDNAGRHLTLVRLGDVRRVLGDLKGAERAYRDANEFRVRKYLKEDRAALAGLADILRARGREGDVAVVHAKVAKCDVVEGRADTSVREDVSAA